MAFANNVAVAICILTSSYCFGKERPSESLDDLLKEYDPLVKPESKGPTIVHVSMSFRYVKWVANTLKLRVYFRQTWNDPRLAKSAKVSRFEDWDIKNHIWTPNSLLMNASTPDAATGMIDISATGNVFWSQAVQFDLPCPTDVLAMYRSDGVVECTLGIQSYTLGAKDLLYAWDKDSVSFVNTSDPVMSWDTFAGTYIYPIDELAYCTIRLSVQTKFNKAVIEFAGQELFARFK